MGPLYSTRILFFSIWCTTTVVLQKIQIILNLDLGTIHQMNTLCIQLCFVRPYCLCDCVVHWIDAVTVTRRNVVRFSFRLHFYYWAFVRKCSKNLKSYPTTYNNDIFFRSYRMVEEIGIEFIRQNPLDSFFLGRKWIGFDHVDSVRKDNLTVKV